MEDPNSGIPIFIIFLRIASLVWKFVGSCSKEAGDILNVKSVEKLCFSENPLCEEYNSHLVEIVQTLLSSSYFSKR